MQVNNVAADGVDVSFVFPGNGAPFMEFRGRSADLTDEASIERFFAELKDRALEVIRRNM